jgi:2-methylisocitrate lyase-like PEP mutase family enzyme
MDQRKRQELATRFMDLHRVKPGFIMPNAWDAGSARIFEAEGFLAIGTTSAGVAFSLGKQDYNVSNPSAGVSKEEMFERMSQVAYAVDIPMNGDLEAGYGDTPEDVATTVGDAITAGLAGGNVEDKKPYADSLYEEDLAVERIAAAATAAGNSFVLTARTDAFRANNPATLATAIRRANRFLEAGATCVFAPGIDDIQTIEHFVREVDGPVNIVAGLTSPEGNVHEMIKAGAQRISLGGSIARSTLGYVRQCARDLRDEGNFDFPSPQIEQADLNSLFSKTYVA